MTYVCARFKKNDGRRNVLMFSWVRFLGNMGAEKENEKRGKSIMIHMAQFLVVLLVLLFLPLRYPTIHRSQADP